MSLKAELQTSFQPTPEQEKIVQAILAGKSVIVTALAGCAKTTTMALAAKALPSSTSGIYLAFNKKVQLEAEGKFPANFQCMTVNGMGHRAWQAGKPRLALDTRKVYKIVEEYLQKNRLTANNEERNNFVQLLNAARTHCLVPADMPYPVGNLLDNEEGWAFLLDWTEIALDPAKVPELLIIARGMLKHSIMAGFNGLIDFNDQIYLPTCFGGAFPVCDVFIGDEAQDFSWANQQMITRIRARQKILVGDPHQAIYAFRGAMTDSMDHLENVMPAGTVWEHLELNRTFRCSKRVVARQKSFVPAFTAAESNQEGRVLHWPDSAMRDYGWGPVDVPDGAAILCRNNAPLISCALKFLRAKRKVSVLGRDFAERLKRDISKATKGAPGAMPIEDVLTAIKAFYEAKLGNKKPTETELEAVQDRIEAVIALSEGCQRLSDLSDNISAIFSDQISPVTFATGHKAKGLEWEFVIHLDPWRIPSKWSENDPEAFQQELNLRYVIETRAKHTLVLASLEDLEI